ncbi:MAG: flagellar motor switch protein FliG, partial [Oscillospiraceae bacterium]|nr:flagellar motor switch protein FliG [Oscillospiraceae bacterium]
MPDNAVANAAAPAAAPAPAKNTKSLPPLTSAQKAAAVVVALGAEKASLLYKYMEADDVEQLTIEVAKLGFLNASQTEEVLNDFYQSCMTNK